VNSLLCDIGARPPVCMLNGGGDARCAITLDRTEADKSGLEVKSKRIMNG
jgi:hypothetical protein